MYSSRIAVCLIILALAGCTGNKVEAREAIYTVIDEFEKGYVNDPQDPGGETKYGISKRAFPNEDIKNLTKERAYDLYKEHYWDKVKAESFPFPINMLLFDFAVHSGPERAVQVLQMTLGVAQDMVVGPRTIAAAQRKGEALKELCAKYLTARTFFLAGLGKTRYIAGWTNRLFKLAFLCKGF